MPGKVKVKILAGRNLPVMDRSSDTTDAYVEVKLGDYTYETDVYRKSLKPAWNSDWFRFEADDIELQDEPLQIRIMDYDTYSANDAIGKVYVDLNPLLLPQPGQRTSSYKENINISQSATGGRVLSGWLPIFDTMHGIRGELNIIVKVELFSDLNKFRQSSCGVQFFCAPEVPEGFRSQLLPGFVEELVVNDDPEYKWIDKIRTPRASNEARQLLFMKLSGEVRRKIGLKVLELGGNAVVGYKQFFDLEGESGIVVRGIGTAVSLVRLQASHNLPLSQVSPRGSRENSAGKEPSDPDTIPSTPFTPQCTAPSPWNFDSPSPAAIGAVPSAATATTPGGPLGSSLPPSHPVPPSTAVAAGPPPSNGCTGMPASVSTVTPANGCTGPTAHSTEPPSQVLSGVTTTLTLASPTSPPINCAGDGGGGTVPTASPANNPFFKQSHHAAATPPATTEGGGGVGGGYGHSLAASGGRGQEADLLLHTTPPRGASAGSESLEKYPLHKHSITKSIDQQQQLQASRSDMAEFPFLTITRFSPGFIRHLGGMVSAKSVKLLEELEDKEDGDTRESWWSEIRQEVRSHARALGCNIIVGYQEKTFIWDDVIILSAAGTAAVCRYGITPSSSPATSSTAAAMAADQLQQQLQQQQQQSHPLDGPYTATPSAATAGTLNRSFTQDNPSQIQTDCEICHIPYCETSVPFPIKLVRCRVCGRGKVPDILLTSVEPPPQAEITGRGGIIQARVIKLKKDLKVELNAREVSDALPFLEYEIHRQIVNKLKVKGMNAVFGLQVTLALSDRLIAGLATGTAVYLTPLPPPPVPRITSTSSMFTDQGHINRVQTKLRDKIEANRNYYGIVETGAGGGDAWGAAPGDGNNCEIEDVAGDLELCTGNKDTCVLEVDDTEDVDIVDSLLDVLPPQGVQLLSVNTPIGVDVTQQVSHCQTFTQIWRGKQSATPRDFSLSAQNLLNTICFKLRRLEPCLISSLNWELTFDVENELQLAVSGVALSLSNQKEKSKEENGEGKDLIFNMEGLQIGSDTRVEKESEKPPAPGKVKLLRNPPYFYSRSKEMFGINVTPMPYIPGARIDQHLGNLNFFFIRESTSIRELGGLSSFVQGFMAEVLAILRTHVAALGGNAVTSYFMSECGLTHSPHKNQAQCLINIGGDCVQVTYVTEPILQ